MTNSSQGSNVVSYFSRGPRTSTPSSRTPAVLTAPAPSAHRTTIASEESPSGRRFGEVLVEEKIITEAQLDTALRLQAASQMYVPLGQVLLANRVISRKQLNALLHRHKKRSRLGDILLKAGRITEEQLQTGLTHQRRTPMPIGQTLIRLGYVNEMVMRDALCTQLHVNFFDLDPIWIDQGLARVISERFAARHRIIPLFQVRNVLVVAMDDPSQAEFIERLQESLGLHIEIVTTTAEKMEAAMARLYGPLVPPDVNVFGRRNILIGQIRDHLVAELADKGLQGISVIPTAWQ